MSLLSNNNTLYFNNRWISPWYENNPIYTNLLYSDIYIYELLNGIYYQLKMPSSLPIIKQLNYDQLIIILNIYVYRKKKQKRINLFYKEKVEFKFFYKKMMFLLHKLLYKKRKYKIYFNRKNLNSMILKKKIYRKHYKDIYVPMIKKKENINISFKKIYLIYKMKKKKYRLKNKYNKKVEEDEKEKIIFNNKNIITRRNSDLIFFLNKYIINKKKNKNKKSYNKLIKLKYKSLFYLYYNKLKKIKKKKKKKKKKRKINKLFIKKLIIILLYYIDNAILSNFILNIRRKKKYRYLYRYKLKKKKKLYLNIFKYEKLLKKKRKKK